MKKKKKFVHPYIPNSVPEVQEEMLKVIGVKGVDEFYEDIPESLRFKGEMNLPEPLLSEYELKRHVEEILAKNKTCQEYLSFLGGGCAQHFVPATCDEINQRSEFLTAYAGEPYEDHGRFQALFEYASMMGELLEMDVVNIPTYDWSQAASTSMRMAARISGRDEILISRHISPDKLAVIQNYCKPLLKLNYIECDSETGRLNIADLKSNISSDTAGVYFENPSYLGIIEDQGQTISDIAHEHGAVSLVGVDPVSLGVLIPPGNYGADIVSGDLQGLGVPMYYGGALAGFIATHDEIKFVDQFPSRLFSITKTCIEGEYGFGDVLYDERTSFGAREKGKEFVGTHTALWGITAGVYLATLGPQGMQRLGKTIIQNSQYAMKKLGVIKGIRIPFQKTASFKEFLVDFSGTGKTVKEINQQLLEKGIFGGKDISTDFSEFDNCALYCVTEIHKKQDIDKLINSLSDCLK